MQDLSIHTFVNPRSNLAFFRISMRFGVKLSILLNRTLSVSFYWKKSFKIVPTTFHYNWPWFILISLLFPNSVRSIQIHRCNLKVHLRCYCFYHITNSSVNSSSSVSTIPWIRRLFGENTAHAYLLFFEIFNFLTHYWHIFFGDTSSWLFILFLFLLSHTRQILCI